MKDEKLIKKLLSSKCFYRAEDGRLIIKITSSSQSGGQCQSIGGHLLRAISAGETDFIIDLPANVSVTAMQIINGAIKALRCKIELTGFGLAEYNRRYWNLNDAVKMA